MCPPKSVPPPARINVFWTDEEIIMLLDKILCGLPFPDNVIPDVNPYEVLPSDLPDGIWYFIRSEEVKNGELGFWKAKGEASNIFTNSAITGWRTTLEFYEGKAPHERITGWVMQDYWITQKGMCTNRKPKDTRSLCRVFLSDGQSPAHKMPPNLGGTDIAARNHFHSTLSTAPNADCTTRQGSTSESQEKNRDGVTGQLAVVEGLQDPPVENSPELDYILGGDYLELDDLADPESPSSSSDNSSCLSLTSEEFFDSLALLQDLEKGKDANFKCSVSASVKPDEVVVHPATLGSLIGGNGSKLSAEGTQKSDYSRPGSAIEGQLLDKRILDYAVRSQQANEGTSNSLDMAASSSSHKAVSEWKKKAPVCRMKKFKKKYLCFLPF